jgi:foldase protein PrsA
MKKLIVSLMLAAVSITAVGCNAEKDANENVVIAKVGDVNIEMKALNEKMSYVEETIEQQFGKDYKNDAQIMGYIEAQKQAAAQYLVELEVIRQKAEALGIKVDEKEIQDEMDTYIKQFPSEKDFVAALKENGFTKEDFIKEIREYKLMAALLDEVTKDIVIDDKQIEEYYNQNISDYTQGPGADMYHILVSTEEEAKKIKEEYEKGESFENLAKKYGTDGTKDLGGSLGFVEYEDPNYDQDFLKGAKPLKDGEVSEPVKSSFGWHIIKVNNIVSKTTFTPLEEVKEEIRELVKAEEKQRVFTKFLENAKKELNAEIYEDKIKVTQQESQETSQKISQEVSEDK